MSAAPVLERTDAVQSPEDELLLRARRGDFAAFVAFVEPHLPRLKRLLTPVAGSADAAEDIVSDTLLRAFRHLHLYEDRRLGTWLQRIGSNLAVSGHRRDAIDRRVREALPKRAERRRESPEEPMEALLREEDAQALQGLMAELPARYRQILHLRFYRDLSVSEIAAELGTTANSVSLVLHRAKRRLQTGLCLQAG